MPLFYPSNKTLLLLKEPKSDLIEYQDQKVNLYLHLAKVNGSDFIEIDREIEFYCARKKILVRVDVVVYNKKMSPKEIYILINPKASEKDKVLIQKYGKMAGVALMLESYQIHFLYPLLNESYSS